MPPHSIQNSKNALSSEQQKVFILHDNPDWAPPLTKELDRLGVPYEEWVVTANHKSTFDLQKPPPLGIFYNRLSASAHTRSNRYGPELGQAILSWLEMHNRTVINTSTSLDLEISKVRQYAAFRKFGIDFPHTTVVRSEDMHALETAGSAMKVPFILKPNRCGKGFGIHMFETQDEYSNHLKSDEFEMSIDGVTLLQEYVQADHIFRLEFVDRKLLYAVKVRVRAHEFRNCPADKCGLPGLPTDGPKYQILEKDSMADHPIVQKMPALMEHFGIGVCSIEFVTDKNGIPYAFDLNMNTNYNSNAENKAERKGDRTGMGAISAMLKDRLPVDLRRKSLVGLSTPPLKRMRS